MRSQVLTAVIMKNAVFCDAMPYNMVEIYQRFGGIYCLHLKGIRCWLLVPPNSGKFLQTNVTGQQHSLVVHCLWMLRALYFKRASAQSMLHSGAIG
jgi:hypothetical protein